MGRFWLELDPDGYQWCREPGVMMDWRAPEHPTQVRAAWGAANPNRLMPSDFMYSLEGSPWLFPKPRQLNADWVKDDRLDKHVLRSETEWTWSPSVAASVREWEPTKKADGTSYPANVWQTVVIPEDPETLFDPGFSAISNASGIPLPEGMAVVGVATHPPAWTHFENKTPFIQYLERPSPDDVLLFGFGQFVVVFHATGIILLKSGPEGYVYLGAWEYSAVGEPKKPTQDLFVVPPAWNTQRKPATSKFRLTERSLLFINFPDGHLGMMFENGQHRIVRHEKVEPGTYPTVGVTGDAWWIAGAEKTTIQMQIQVVGYEHADTGVMNTGPNSIYDFDLGNNYHPTIEPIINAYMLMHREGPTAPDTVLTHTQNLYSLTSSSTGEAAILNLDSETNLEPWASDGTHRKGRWRLEIQPSNDGGGAYLTPWVRNWSLRFPVLLENRLNSPLLLDDHQFSTVNFETSLLEPDGKRLTVTLWDTGLKLLHDAGFDVREGYPIRLLEDTDADDIPDTVRAVAWVLFPDIEEFVAETPSRDPVRFYHLTSKGILERGKSTWAILPTMCDPSDSTHHVEHTFAVRQTVLSMGVDVDNPAQYAMATDTMAGTARSRLPGTWGNKPYTLQLDSNNVYAPKFGEEKLAYAEKIARQWAGWKLYENSAGQVRYHPDLEFELSLGVGYYVSFQVWNNSADAIANSMPGQRYLAGAMLSLIPVEANSITVTGKQNTGEDGNVAPVPDWLPVVVTDTLAINSPSYENFLGEPRSKEFCLELATDQQSAEILATVALLDLGRRRVDIPVEVPLAPWAMVTDDSVVEVGYVGEFQGLGDRLVVHMEVTLLLSRADAEGGSIFRTRLVGRRLPELGVKVVEGIPVYPGRANPA